MWFRRLPPSLTLTALLLLAPIGRLAAQDKAPRPIAASLGPVLAEVVFEDAPAVQRVQGLPPPLPPIGSITGQPRPATPATKRLVELAAESNLWMPNDQNCGCIQSSLPGYWDECRKKHTRSYQECLMDFRDGVTCQAYRLGDDFCNMYWSANLCDIALSVGLVAPLANTHADQGVRDWYQQHLRSQTSDDVAHAGKQLGQLSMVVPILITATAVGYSFPDTPGMTALGDWGVRSGRALIVGAPAVVILETGLGAGQPNERDHASYWRPGKDHDSVTGIGYVAAVPFLTAASMTEDRSLKALFVAGSLIGPWARVHDDSHYLSQAALGWSLAYIAVCSVTMTEQQRGNVSLTPIALPQGAGVGVVFRY